MTLGLYQIGEGQPITRVRRGRTTHAKRGHLVPVYNTTSRFPTQSALCGIRPVGIQGWRWIDDGEDCATCVAQARHKLSVGELVVAHPAVVAEFERLMLAHLSDRQAAAAQSLASDTRLIVEIDRPDNAVVGSTQTTRTIHRVGCEKLGYGRKVPLPVAEVRRQLGADGRRTDFCQECKPGDVLDRDRLRPKTMTGARALSAQLGSRARERAVRAGVRPVRDHGGGVAFNGASEAAGDAYYAAGCPSTAALALGELKMHGAEHYPGCPAEPEALLEGDAADPDFGRCTCYDLNDFEESSVRRKEDALWQRYRDRHPLNRRRRRLDPAPEWTL